MEKKSFDFEAFKKSAAEHPLLKTFLEEGLEGELEARLDEDEEPNRKNGKGGRR